MFDDTYVIIVLFFRVAKYKFCLSIVPAKQAFQITTSVFVEIYLQWCSQLTAQRKTLMDISKWALAYTPMHGILRAAAKQIKEPEWTTNNNRPIV